MPRADGFTKCPNWLYDEGWAAFVGPNAVSVYLCLKRHEGRHGLSYPGVNRIVEQTGLSKPTVILALKALNDCEVIQEDRQSDIPGKHPQTVAYRLDKPSQPVNALNRSNLLTGQCVIPNRSMRDDQPVNALNRSYIITDLLNKTKNKTNCASSASEPVAFTSFWKAYPRNENRKKALEWWRRHKPSQEKIAEIAAGLKRWKASDQWARGVIPHAITWLNQERWQDEPSPAGTAYKAGFQANGTHTKPQTLEEQYATEAEAIARLGL